MRVSGAGTDQAEAATHVLKALRALLLAASLVFVSGCYTMQAASGQWHVLHERVPIGTLIADPHTSPALREHLTEARAAREFATRELGLPDNQSYRSYADVGREYVVWNVVAAPEFSVKPERWCFPVAGCVAYRGYFHEKQARDFAEGLKKRGFDVIVEGVPAYSTLGKFADPLLSSMLPYGDDEVAATVFHELAHQLLYVRDDSEFNEAFATTVEDTGLERWLIHQGASARIEQFRAEQTREQELFGLLAKTRTRLAELYASGAGEEEMRTRKAEIFADLAAEIHALGRREGVSYEKWLAAGLNNARLASIATYYDCVPGFTRLLKTEADDLPRFYAAARQLAHASRTERHEKLCETREAGTYTAR